MNILVGRNRLAGSETFRTLVIWFSVRRVRQHVAGKRREIGVLRPCCMSRTLDGCRPCQRRALSQRTDHSETIGANNNHYLSHISDVLGISGWSV